MIEIVFAIFAVIALGYIARFFSLLPESAYKPLNDFVYYISMPLLIFTKLAGTNLGPEHLLLASANALPMLICFALVAILWKMRVCKPKVCALLLLASCFGNIVYMGFPAIQLRFGAGAIADGAIISLVTNLLMFTIGFALIGMMSGAKWGKLALEKITRNTIIPACVFGALFSLSGLVIPSALLDVLSSVGSTTTPLALFSMGLFIYGKKFGKNTVLVGAMSLAKLALFPAIFVSCALLLGLTGTHFDISLLEAMMPLAVTNFVIAEKFELDSEAMAQAVIVSTLLAIPFLLGFDYILPLL